jgi:hypothetical protein
MEPIVIGIIVVGILFIIAVVITIIASSQKPKYKKVVATPAPWKTVRSSPMPFSFGSNESTLFNDEGDGIKKVVATLSEALYVPPVAPPPEVAPPPVVVPFSFGSNESTPFSNNIFLEDHNIDCKNKALNRIHLGRDSKGNYNFDYTCNSGGQIGTSIDKSTPLNDDGGGNTSYLERHDINCGTGSALTQMKLSRDGKGHIKYNYKCAPSTKPLTCRQAFTGFNDTGGNNTYYLDRHDVKCNADEALSQLKYTGDAATGKYEYQYTCCK